MARRNRSFVRRAAGPRRATEWGFLSSTGTQNLAANTFIQAGSISQALFGDSTPLTLIRTRGYLFVATDQAAATETPLGAAGVVISTEAARVAGAASLPDPTADEDTGVWQTYVPFVNQFKLVNATGVDGNSGTMFMVDSKAMRKIDTGFALNLMISNASTLHGMVFAVNFRFLFKLH